MDDSTERQRFVEKAVPHDLPIELIESAVMLARFLDKQKGVEDETE